MQKNFFCLFIITILADSDAYLINDAYFRSKSLILVNFLMKRLFFRLFRPCRYDFSFVSRWIKAPHFISWWCKYFSAEHFVIWINTFVFNTFNYNIIFSRFELFATSVLSICVWLPWVKFWHDMQIRIWPVFS